MNRRDWLRRAALIAGGALAADQIELIEKLTPKRYVGGWRSNTTNTVRVGPGKNMVAFLTVAYASGKRPILAPTLAGKPMRHSGQIAHDPLSGVDVEVWYAPTDSAAALAAVEPGAIWHGQLNAIGVDQSYPVRRGPLITSTATDVIVAGGPANFRGSVAIR